MLSENKLFLLNHSRIHPNRESSCISRRSKEDTPSTRNAGGCLQPGTLSLNDVRTALARIVRYKRTLYLRINFLVN